MPVKNRWATVLSTVVLIVSTASIAFCKDNLVDILKPEEQVIIRAQTRVYSGISEKKLLAGYATAFEQCGYTISFVDDSFGMLRARINRDVNVLESFAKSLVNVLDSRGMESFRVEATVLTTTPTAQGIQTRLQVSQRSFTNTESLKDRYVITDPAFYNTLYADLEKHLPKNK